MTATELESALLIIGKINYGTLATVSAAQCPWNSPVLMVHDTDLNFYWFSDKQSQHGKNVRDNDNVFIVIYNSTVPIDTGAVDRGFYVQAKAYELSDLNDIKAARRLRRGSDRADDSNNFVGEAIRRIYKAVPEQVWVNTVEIKDGKFIRDHRVEVSLPALKLALRGAV